MNIELPDHLPTLAKGSHDAGSGRACIMNAISYLQGDIRISDAPSCVWQPIRSIAIGLNDSICDHTNSAELCEECAHTVWLAAVGAIGTAEVAESLTEREREQLRFRINDKIHDAQMAKHGLNLNKDPKVLTWAINEVYSTALRFARPTPKRRNLTPADVDTITARIAMTEREYVRTATVLARGFEVTA